MLRLLPKPEKVAGIVALSYLVLIPVGAALAYKKLWEMDQDVSTMWDELNMSPDRASNITDVKRLNERLKTSLGRWSDRHAQRQEL